MASYFGDGTLVCRPGNHVHGAPGSCGRYQGAPTEAGVGSPPSVGATPRSAATPWRPSGSGGEGPSAALPRLRGEPTPACGATPGIWPLGAPNGGASVY